MGNALICQSPAQDEMLLAHAPKFKARPEIYAVSVYANECVELVVKESLPLRQKQLSRIKKTVHVSALHNNINPLELTLSLNVNQGWVIRSPGTFHT